MEEERKEEDRGWWLILVILGTHETEIRRITVLSQPGQIVHETIWKISNTKKGWQSD
jgi:hypothetical protein